MTPEVLARPNLTIATNIMVEKILFSESEPLRAIGVQVSTSKTGPKYKIAAGKEVILSAGTFATPQLLLISGVGPKDELAALDVKCVKHSPHVGKHMLDVRTDVTIVFLIAHCLNSISQAVLSCFALSQGIRWTISTVLSLLYLHWSSGSYPELDQ